ncbi:MAG: NAD(P)-dependent oxidoreductase [Bacteroidales bacterium]|nr:NAD(P)-dependent oxidoreductase [Bacteroidales bacterium]MDD4218229.1 NAD(P)-dependent oxidoreductase [Bacteroidales bacterium]MDY0143658.1 NAD(P)-dependent oxidoreductase [Bacteroidales bacterium]
MIKSILIVDDVHPIIPKELSAAGFNIIDATKLDKNELINTIQKASGIIIRSRITIDCEIIDAAKSLQFIARVGAGMESIDTEYCKRQNIICLNSPEGNRDAVGEHAVGMLLSLLNNLNIADKQVKSGIWQRETNRGRELGSMCVGIIGYGNMGSSFAQKLSGFGCKTISYDKYKTGYADGNTTEVSLVDIFEKSDVLSLHVPLTEETNYLVDENFISNFKKDIFLINTARGFVVKTQDLVAGLKTGKILGAALDVIEYEESSFEKTGDLLNNKNFQYLAKQQNVIMSPHIAGWTNESKLRLATVLIDKIKVLNL